MLDDVDMGLTTGEQPESAAVREVTSFCRICGGGCGTRLRIDQNDRIVDIRGDRAQPMSRGYACFKGLQAEEAHHGPARLLHPLKRQPDGSFAPIPLEQALDEIAEKLRQYVESGEAESIALYNGNGSTPCSSAHGMHYSFMEAIGSPSHFTTLSIDQSAKVVSFERLGGWMGGIQGVDQADVALFFGTNPLVSHSGLPVISADPVKRLKEALDRGMKLIVVDPRKTETANFAHLVVQPIPGQDSAIAGALVRMILDEGWGDEAFYLKHAGADRVAALRAALDPLKPEFVEPRAGIPAGSIRRIAELFARNNKHGPAIAATGPSMAPHSNLMQHLVDVLNVICGRMRRTGDRVNVDMLSPDTPVYASVIPPMRSWNNYPPSRIRGVGRLAREKLSGTLPEEILVAGKGQVRCLLVSGANPASSVPDTARMVGALRSLDLLVTIEPYMTVTARLSHYIIPPKMQYERADLPLSIPGYPLFPVNWAQFTPPLLRTPEGSDLCDDWYPFWAVAKRLGIPINYVGKEFLPVDRTPVTEDLLEIRLKGARVSLDELKRHPSGKIFDVQTCFVQEPPEGAEGKFDLIPDDVRAELGKFLAMTVWAGHVVSHGKAYSHLLSTRRMRDVFNSNGPQLSQIKRRMPYNPAYLCSSELAALDLKAGDEVILESDHAEVKAIVGVDDALRPGVISIAYGWGGLPDDAPGQWDGAANVNLLIACDRDVEVANAMPRMSAVPINIRRA